jgi:hypothetical protein
MTAIPEDQVELDDGPSGALAASSISALHRYPRSTSWDPTWMNQSPRSFKAEATADGAESILSEAQRDSPSITSTIPDQYFHLMLLNPGEQKAPTPSYLLEPSILNFRKPGNQKSSTITFPVFRSSVFSLLGKFRSW